MRHEDIKVGDTVWYADVNKNLPIIRKAEITEIYMNTIEWVEVVIEGQVYVPSIFLLFPTEPEAISFAKRYIGLKIKEKKREIESLQKYASRL
jgi:uncharacterized protein YpbB